MQEWRDNVPLRAAWERRTGGTITLDDSAHTPLWRARDAANAELVQAHDLGIVMRWLDRLDEAAERREKFLALHPDARFWAEPSDAGPLRYYGSLPAPADRIESGPHRELADLMNVMDALAARALEMRGR